jgi:hypothetical protein
MVRVERLDEREWAGSEGLHASLLSQLRLLDAALELAHVVEVQCTDDCSGGGAARWWAGGVVGVGNVLLPGLAEGAVTVRYFSDGQDYVEAVKGKDGDLRLVRRPTPELLEHVHRRALPPPPVAAAALGPSVLHAVPWHLARLWEELGGGWEALEAVERVEATAMALEHAFGRWGRRGGGAALRAVCGLVRGLEAEVVELRGRLAGLWPEAAPAVGQRVAVTRGGEAAAAAAVAAGRVGPASRERVVDAAAVEGVVVVRFAGEGGCSWGSVRGGGGGRSERVRQEQIQLLEWLGGSAGGVRGGDEGLDLGRGGAEGASRKRRRVRSTLHSAPIGGRSWRRGPGGNCFAVLLTVAGVGGHRSSRLLVIIRVRVGFGILLDVRVVWGSGYVLK